MTEDISLDTLLYSTIIYIGNSPNEVQNLYPRGTNFFEVQTVKMGYCTPKWGTVGSPERERERAYCVTTSPQIQVITHSYSVPGIWQEAHLKFFDRVCSAIHKNTKDVLI